MTQTRSDLKHELEALAAAKQAQLSLCFLRLDQPVSFEINAQAILPIASTFKVNLLLAALEACSLGQYTEESCFVLQDYHQVPGSILLEKAAGSSLSLRELLELICRRSDNSATDLLCEVLPLREILQKMPSWGIHSTEFLAPTKLMIHLLTNLWPDLQGKTVAEQIHFWQGCSTEQKWDVIEASYAAIKDIPLSELQRAADDYFDALPIPDGKRLVQALGWQGSTRDYAQLMRRLVLDELMEPWVNQKARHYLELASQGLIGAAWARFSEQASFTLGRKGGSDEGMRGDTGYVLSPDGRQFALSITVLEQGPDEDSNDELEALIESICLRVFQHFFG